MIHFFQLFFLDHYDLACTSANLKLLHKLATDEDWLVRWRVAWNSNTTPETLNLLATDKNSVVRYRVAENFNTFPETLRLLSNDKEFHVREAVARNKNCPLNVYKYIQGLKILENKDFS